jgi:hypothetical protein
VPALGKRLGVSFTLVWQAIFLIVGFNVVYNHFFAMIIEPTGPKELRNIEQLRQRYKNRTHRKSVEKYLDDDLNDRFEGISKEVK